LVIEPSPSASIAEKSCDNGSSEVSAEAETEVVLSEVVVVAVASVAVDVVLSVEAEDVLAEVEAASEFCIIIKSCRIWELKSPLPLPVSAESVLVVSDEDDVESVEVVDDVLLVSVVDAVADVDDELLS
jgi:hypothetical protein